MVIVSLMKDTGWSPSKVEESLKELLSIPDGFTPPVRSWKPSIPV